MCRWICPKFARGWPNAVRSLAYLFMISMLRRAMPRDMAASASLSSSKFRIMCRTASPSLPTKFLTGI
jgi:hypothetical protein